MVETDARDLIELSSGGLSARFAPALGGRLICLARSSGTDILVPLAETTFDPMFWPKAGAYPLIPYHNRIAGGHLKFGGRTLAIPAHPDALPHSLHGPAHRRKWTARRVLANSVTMNLEYKPDDDWPWAFEAWQRFHLNDETMTIELGVRNVSDAEMPGGLGWHPYIAGACDVEHDAAFCWPHGSNYLPEGRRLRNGVGDAEALSPTAYLQGWSYARTKLADGSIVVITAEPVFEHLVVHQGAGYTCIEAVTHLADGFNLAACGMPFTGTIVLGPGEELQGVITVSVVAKET